MPYFAILNLISWNWTKYNKVLGAKKSLPKSLQCEKVSIAWGKSGNVYIMVKNKSQTENKPNTVCETNNIFITWG